MLNLGRIFIKIETHFYEYPQILAFFKRSFYMLIFEEELCKEYATVHYYFGSIYFFGKYF